MNIQVLVNKNRCRVKDLHTIASPAELRALADPLRQRILAALVERPATAKQVAALLGEKATKLYHHFGTLEAAGLIGLVETRAKRGTVEKYYRAVAEDFAVDRDLLEGTRGPARGYAALLL